MTPPDVNDKHRNGTLPADPFGDDYSEPLKVDPLCGLELLPRIAVVGRAHILAKAREPVVYTWQDIAVAATIVLLAGGPSGGKTTLLFLLLAARMNLGDVLGRKVTPAPGGQFVVLVEAEHGDSSACRKLARSCALAGVDDRALERVIVIARKAVRLGSPEWKEIVAMVKVGFVSDIALDTLARVAPADANDEQQQAGIFETISQAIELAPRGREPMVWVCAHTRKGEGNSGDDVAGSAQRVGQADSLLMVKGNKDASGRTASSLVTFWKLREEPDVYPAPVTFAIVRSDGAESVRLAGDAPSSTETEVPLETRVEELLTIKPHMKSALARVLKRSNADVDGAIGNLFAARRITSWDETVRGRPRRVFGLRADAPKQMPLRERHEADA